MEDTMNLTSKIYTKLPADSKILRETIFVQEQGFEEEFDTIDSIATHIVIYDGERAIATGRVFSSEYERGFRETSAEKVYVLGRVAVSKDYRGQHIGEFLLSEVEKYVTSQGGDAVILHAQCRIRKFYANSGYEQCSGVELDEGCPHVWMRKYFSNQNVQ